MNFQDMSDVYLALLQHKHDEWRAKNQHIYCKLRDEIARTSGKDAETVQNMYEECVARLEDWAWRLK